MELESFTNARAMRLRLKPRMALREMARKLEISPAFLADLENGFRCHGKWPAGLKDKFMRVSAEWESNPTPLKRKTRSDKKVRPQLVHADA